MRAVEHSQCPSGQGSVLVVDSGDLNPITQPEVVPAVPPDNYDDWGTLTLFGRFHNICK